MTPQSAPDTPQGQDGVSQTADERVLKSFVWHEGQCFFVSTIERPSSAMEGPRRFNETMVWLYDWDKKERASHFMAQEGDSVGSLRTHFRVCENIFTRGNPTPDDDEQANQT